MEVVGAVASVAGIASLVAQSLSGLAKLIGFFKDYRDASKTIGRFLLEINSLEGAVKDVEILISRVEKDSEAAIQCNLASLNIHLDDCTNDVNRWLKQAEETFGYAGFMDTKAWFKNFLVATKKQSIKDVFQEMASHKANISLSLSAIGRLLDMQMIVRSDLLLSKVTDTTNYGKVTVEALSRLEGRFENTRAYDDGVLRTAQSFSSMASAISRIESLVSTRLSPASNSGSHSNNPPVLGRRCSESSLYMQSMNVSHLGEKRNSDVFISHEREKQYTCSVCRSRHSTQDELERHTSIHNRTSSWSCAALSSEHEAIFFLPDYSTSGCVCGYCGMGFPEYDQELSMETYWTVRAQHVKLVHDYGTCNRALKYFRRDDFLKHLHQFHASKPGPWIDILAKVSRQDEVWDESSRQGSAKENNLQHDPSALLLPRLLDEPNLAPVLEPLDFFGTLDVLITRGDGTVPTAVGQYIKYLQVAETTKAYIRMLSVLSVRLDQSRSAELWSKLQTIEEHTTAHLSFVVLELERSKQACWKEGYDLDAINQSLKCQPTTDSNVAETALPDKNSSFECQQRMWWDVLHHIQPQNWLTKEDRINSWLLQNLAAMPDEEARHRAFLKDGDRLGEEEWAKLVLKFWPLDEAAPGLGKSVASTNSAVNSQGACHSARVLLESLPFQVAPSPSFHGSLPFRERTDVGSEITLLESHSICPQKRKRDSS